MSQSEWNNAWESAQKVLIIYIPYVIASLIISICGYIERHWRKEPFSAAKLITGLFSDIVYGMMLVLGALWLSNGNHKCAMFVLFLGLSRGKKWADSVIDRILRNRYDNGYYGGYQDTYGPQFPPQDNMQQGDEANNGNKNNDNGDKGLDPRE